MAKATVRHIAIGLIAGAVIIFAAWSIWVHTRTWCPVDPNVILNKGNQVRVEFPVNIDLRYEVEIEANNDLPGNTVWCMLGAGPYDVSPLMAQEGEVAKPCSIRSSLDLAWMLLASGATIATGSSHNDLGASVIAADSTVARTLGYFQGHKGTHYTLQLDVLSDGEALNGMKPRLRVSQFDPKYEFILVITGILKFICTTLGFTGGILLAVSLLRRRRATVATSAG